MKLKREKNESKFEYKLRLYIAKLNKEIDLDWSEIVELIGEEISPDHARKTAYGVKEYYDYLHNNKGVANRVLSISDLHIPYQLPITTFKQYVGNVDILQLNGDILDCQSLSKFPKMYRISFMEEMIEGRKYLIDLINYIKPKKVIVNYGNHDARMGQYLAKNLDSDIIELMPNNPLELILMDGFNHNDKRNRTKTYYDALTKVFEDEVEIVYTESWYCQIGDAIFCHPSAFSSGMMATAQKAMTWFRNEGYVFKKLVMAHTHRVGSYEIGNTTIFEQGTCSETKKQHYIDGKLVNSQKEGFIYICQDEDGNTIDSKTNLVCLN